jgi:hypothetical protein
MASLTGQRIKDTYKSLLKLGDNGQISSIDRNISDGEGSGSGLFLSETGATISGSFQVSGSILLPPNSVISGSFSGSGEDLYGILASSVVGLELYRIATGSVTASVDVNPDSIFLVKSGSVNFFNISSSGDSTITSDLFMVRSISTKSPVFTVSQSVIKIATQSIDPINPTDAGTIWFTSSSMYVGLE